MKDKFDRPGELEEDDDYTILKEKNGANKRRRLAAADDAVLPEMDFGDDRRESPTSSQNTQEMTTAETNARGVIDFSLYTSAMISEEAAKKTEQQSGQTAITQLFAKKPLLQISKLR